MKAVPEHAVVLAQPVGVSINIVKISKKYNIPCTYCGDITQTSKVVLHLNSANTNNTIINYFHIPKEKNYCFVCPNLPGNSFEGSSSHNAEEHTRQR